MTATPAHSTTNVPVANVSPAPGRHVMMAIRVPWMGVRPKQGAPM